MDYKYIEQLLERYWDCATSPEEESILKAFFSQKEVPEGLAKHKALFEYEHQQAQVHLDEAFDERVLAAIGEPSTQQTSAPKVVKVAHIGWMRRLRPLYRAAAAVAIVTLLGTAAQHSFTQRSDNPAGWDYNQQAYKDSYEDPQKAYEAGMKALEMFKEGPQTAVVDTMHKPSKEPQPMDKD